MSYCFVTRRTRSLSILVGTALLAVGHANAQQCTSCSVTGANLGCVTVPGTGGYHCTAGGQVALESGTTLTTSGSLTGCGVTLAVNATFTTTTRRVFAAPACSHCNLVICFSSATLRVRTCEEWICDAWEYIPQECTGPGQHPTRVCIAGHHETRTTTSVTSRGAPSLALQCTDASCYCRQTLGHLSCACETNPQPPVTPIGPVNGYFPLGANSVNFELLQVANRGRSIDPGPLNGISDLNLAQAFEVSSNIEAAIDDWGYDRNDTETVLLGADGSMLNATYVDWRTQMNARMQFLTVNTKRADINGDQSEDVSDIVEMLTQIVAMESGGAWLSKADVNGDKALTEKDLCEVIDVVFATN
jgi:predicted RecA/RadA family phage recombinase